MGCGGSKEQDPKEIKKIRTEFAKTKIAKFDDFFEKASGLLENAEKIRAGLDDAKDDGKELTDCYKLKNYEYADVVKVLFWSLSANAKGNIKNTKVRVSEEAPFVHLDYFDGLLIETREVADSFEAFLGAVTGAPEAIKGIIENLTDMLSQSAELSKSGPDDIKNSGLNVIDQAKATANLAKNCAKLAKEVPKVQQLPPLIQDAVKDLKILVPQFKQIYNNCDEIGAKAYQEFTIAKPKDIFHKFHTGERKTAEELEAEQKEEEKKHGKKHKKKDDKKKDDKKHGKKDDKKDDKKDHDKKDDKKDHDNKDEKKEEHHKK